MSEPDDENKSDAVSEEAVIDSLIKALPGRVIVIWSADGKTRAYGSESMDTPEFVGLLELVKVGSVAGYWKP